MPQKQRVRNWNAYNKALRKRGDLFLYFNEDFFKNEWLFNGKQKPGGQRAYSNVAIEMMLSIRSVLRLPLRQAQGFVESVVKRLGYNVAVPDYTTVSRRAKSLSLRVKCYNKIDPNKPLHLLIDSTGLSVYSGTYFHLTKYQSGRHLRNGNAWKKLHVAYDVASSQVTSAHLSNSNIQDAQPVEALSNIPGRKVGSIYADRAYDKVRCYRVAHALGAKAIIPPSRSAALQKDNRNRKYEEALKPRDESIRFIRQYPNYDEGVKEWKKQKGYHERSKIESLMHRYKRAFGFTLQSKTMETMRAETITKISILNIQKSLGGAEFEVET